MPADLLSLHIFKGGCYSSQLRPFINTFPKENFLFLITDDLHNNFPATMHSVYKFLNVKNIQNKSVSASNPAQKIRSMTFYKLIRKPSFLKEFFKPFISNSTRHKLKLALQQFNMKKTSYPPLEEDLAKELRERYMVEISELEKIINRDLSLWVKEIAGDVITQAEDASDYE